jgi:predicted aspartyl protease
MKTRRRAALYVAVVSAVIATQSIAVIAEETTWQREEVNWQAPAGSQIKAISYPQDKRPMLSPTEQPVTQQRLARFQQVKPGSISAQSGTAASIIVQTINVDSPPVAGFAPWIAISVTKARSTDDDYMGAPTSSVTGSYPTGVNPDTDFVIGLYDTGASGHVFGYANAQTLGFFRSSLVTHNDTVLSGVTGSVDASVSYPLGVFVDGLHAVDPNTVKLDRTGMVGETNVAVLVGQQPGSNPDLATTIGSPMSVFYTSLFCNQHPVKRTWKGTEYMAPDIHLYNPDDSNIPVFSNTIPLELRPLGGAAVMYIPTIDMGNWYDELDLEDILMGDFTMDMSPSTPSIIVGNGYQSLFFVSSVDLYNGSSTAIDKTRFMLDTGAQVTVIGSRIASRLHINPAQSDFEVEIDDVTGTKLTYPGFFIDEIDIPALGDWVSFEHVPVVLMDVASPEGGTLDGIIGMNLFTEFNLLLKGGALSMSEDPSLGFEPITSITRP